MTESNSSEKKIILSDLATRFSVAFTDVQRIVLQKRLIDGDTFDSIGGLLSVCNARVRHIENTSFEKLTK